MPIRVVSQPLAMQALAESHRQAGGRIALVPTMGALHEGHASLLHEGRRRGDLLVLSLFVNPTQFGPNEDLAAYPRTMESDLDIASRAGVDVVFAPPDAAMYPPGFETTIDVPNTARGLCGAVRPGHFRGVATVVAKLLNIVRPHVALFGEKDYQQLMVIRRMVQDLDMGVEVVGMPTVREADGLAMSSRNRYLSGPDRARATALYRGLQAARALAEQGVFEATSLVGVARAVIEPTVDRIDYVELRDADTLAAIARLEKNGVLLVAAHVGRARLIDNLRIALVDRP